MKRSIISISLFAAFAVCLTGCQNAADTEPAQTSTVQTTEPAAESTDESDAETESAETTALAVASGDDTIAADPVGYEGMQAVSADALKDGTYSISVDSSSSMFRITDCELTVADGAMQAALTMSGSGYGYLYMGTAEQAAASDESAYIADEDDSDTVRFTVPVEALDKEIDCAAFSKKKELWYDRKLVFRADSLPDDAFKESRMATAESLELADGTYTAAVTLEGGSGKASVQSPAKLTVSGGNVTAEIVWSSNNYDYMLVSDEKYLPVSTDPYSVFEIPVSGFDYPMPVSADTTAMSTPHEIEYTLKFDSASVTPQ